MSEALQSALTATIHTIRMRARRMVFTVPAGFLTASSSGPVRGLEAVDSLADAILMADGTLTDIVTLTVGVDSAAEDLTIADAASAVADR
jgi:hypothetical protein